MLAVRDAEAAIRFYQVAFGAELLWRLGDHSDIVAGLSIDGAELYLASESPEFGTGGLMGRGSRRYGLNSSSKIRWPCIKGRYHMAAKS